MQLFYTDSFRPGAEEIILSIKESTHITKVLRKRVNENILLTDGNGHLIEGKIEKVLNEQLTVQVENFQFYPYPSENLIVVALAIIRPNRLDWAIEKLTELGIFRIVPLVCRYNTYHNVKMEHLRKISISAIKQSNQFYLPQIAPISHFHEWVQSTEHENGIKIIVNIQDNANKSLKKMRRTKGKVHIAIGPEGGFHPDELELSSTHQFQQFGLGKTILRTETAAVVAVSQLKMFLE